MSSNRGYIHSNISNNPKYLKDPQIFARFVYLSVSFQSTATTPDFKKHKYYSQLLGKKKNHTKKQTTFSIVPFTGYSFSILNLHAITDGNCPISSNTCISLWKVPR